MSSKILLVNNKERSDLSRHFRRDEQVLSSRLWRQERSIRSRSRNRSKSRLEVTKKIKKLQKSRSTAATRLLKKKKMTIKMPATPHNTTQYIIDAHNSDLETSNIYFDHDRFQFDFQHHAMAGSMMGNLIEFPSSSNTFVDMLTNNSIHPHSSYGREVSQSFHEGFSQEEQNCQVEQDNTYDQEEEKNERPMIVEPWNLDKIESVNSMTISLDTDFCNNIDHKDKRKCDPYSELLKRNQTGEDLQGQISYLINILAQKEEQIRDLKMKIETQKNSEDQL